MKLLMMIVDETKKEELEVLLARSGAGGYTELPGAIGLGTTGPRLASRAFPGTSAVIFTVLDDAAADRLATDIKEYCRGCGERLKLMLWRVEEVA